MEGTGMPSSPAAPPASTRQLRRGLIHSLPDADPVPDTIDAFQRRAAELLADLVLPDDNPAADILSLAWTRRLLDAFLLCLEEFRALLLVGSGNGDSPAARPPLDRLVADFFDCAVKALDLCNAVRDGLDLVQQWRKRLAIAAAVLTSNHARPHGKGEAEICIRRARKALTDLTVLTRDDRADRHGGGGVVGQLNRSYRRANKDSRGHRHGEGLHLCSSPSGSSSSSRSSSESSSGSHSSSWSVSQPWSAARQLQAIGGGLPVPLPHDDAATGGLASAVYTMGAVLFIVYFALVAAIPCQDRGLQAHFSVPRNFLISGPVTTLYDRIVEESKKEERRNSCGLLKEIQQIELCARHFMESTNTAEFKWSGEKASQVMVAALDLVQVCEYIKHELGPLQGRIREMFHRIVRTHTDFLDCLSRLQVTDTVHRPIDMGTLITNRGKVYRRK